MKSLLDIIAIVCDEFYVPMAEEVFGDAGLDAIFKVMDAVKALYRHVDPERIGGQIIIFQIIPSLRIASTFLPVEPITDLAGLANQNITDLMLEIAADGQIYSRAPEGASVENLAMNAVVYRYQAAREEFLAGSQRRPIVRLDAAARSQFCVPTLSTLREALQHYARENVRESTCYIFEKTWLDQSRLFFKAKPESLMRDSLTQFLRNRLGGDHDIWPEQNVDESHPVDIQVKPRFTNNRVMLIEIKWLGYSVGDDGRITARHGAPRAQDGAVQLAQYLENKRRFAPGNVIQGYYVIIDGRRNNLRLGKTTISRVDGMYFENLELTFNPAPHQTRSDFDPPYRMFARPICCD